MRASAWFLICLAALLPSEGWAQREPITLEAMADASAEDAGSPGNPLAWAPDEERFVYRQGSELRLYIAAERGSRRLLEVQPLDDAAVVDTTGDRQPFDWENRRVSGSSVQWAYAGGDAGDENEGGDHILFATGGDLFWIEVPSGDWTQLTKTDAAEEDPKLSPDSRSVAFRRDWDVYVLDIETGEEHRLTEGGSADIRNGGLDWVYPEELGLGTAYWWSPDSESIAYLQFDVTTEPLVPHSDLLSIQPLYEPQRFPQAGADNPRVRLGVVSAQGGETRWMPVGDTVRGYLIARVTWTPDSEELYVIRTTRLQDQQELIAYDPVTGESQQILEETDPYWVNLQAEPRFIHDGDQFLWLSELGEGDSQGFRHIYLYNRDGSSKQALTAGAWEVTAINGVDEEAGLVYFTSSEPGPLERHLYSIHLDGTGKQQISEGTGTHSMSISPDARYYLHTFSSTTTPTVTRLMRTNGEGEPEDLGVYRELDRSILSEYEFLPTEFLRFEGPDGTLLDARLIRPANFDPQQKYPVVVQVYGGPHAQSVRDSWAGLSIDQVLAHAGFVVWQLDNRGSAGRGHAFESPVNRELGVSELEDQVAGVEHLISMGFVDPERIGISGWSYGGFMTLNALLNAPDTFAAGAAGAPVTDWRNYDTIYTERYMGLPTEDVEGGNLDGYESTSLIGKAANLKGELLLLHNFEDDNVLIQNTIQMIAALEKAGKHFDLVLYTQKTHGVSGSLTGHRDREIVEFFERTLKK